MLFILAVSEDGVIGIGNELPWRIPDEYEYFVQKVSNPRTVLLCGRRTFDCLQHEPGQLLQRVGGCLVLTTSHIDTGHSTHCIAHLEHAVEFACPPEHLWCIGGATLYERIQELRPERVYLTMVKRPYLPSSLGDGDTSENTHNVVKLSDQFFEYLTSHYRKIILSEKCLRDTKNGVWVPCQFTVYIRK